MARVFIFATVLLLIGCTSTTRLYSGGDRAAASVAKVIATDEVRIAAIDSKRVGDAHRDESPIAWTFKKVEYELPPGEHRLTIQFDKYEGTEAVGPNTYAVHFRRSKNYMTMRYLFEANKQYSFAVTTTEGPAGRGIWLPTLIELGQGKDRRTVARPEMDGAELLRRSFAASRPFAARFASSAPAFADTSGLTSGGATISGLAAAGGFTAAGRDVRMMPKTPQAAAWLNKSINWYNTIHSGFRLFPENAPPQPDAVKRAERRTMGYGMGEFRFDNVPPGDYVLLFRGVRFDTDTWCMGDVTVRPRQTRIEGVKLAKVGK